jgi:trehalose 6-phosphate synthase
MVDSEKLIIVSNRLPVSISRSDSGQWEATPSAGGLATALDPALRHRGGLWVGWPGVASSESADVESCLKQFSRNLAYELVPVALSNAEVDNFYNGFSNEVIWPLFHDLFPLCNFDPAYWDAYKSANRRFADAVADLAKPGDLVWVHDYHLIGVAAELRTMGNENRIGFFNHIPFPMPDIFFRLPWRDSILRALLQFDLIGFQTASDCDNFAQCVQIAMHNPVSLEDLRTTYSGPLQSDQINEWISARSKETRLAEFPISIDYKSFSESANGSVASHMSAELKHKYGARKIVLGVDRLDHSKGLPNKLAAFRHALKKYPELRGKVTLVQYVVPSREDVPEYQNLRLKIEREISEINGTMSELGWIPIHYRYGFLDREQLCAYYRSADACLITSLKDGMNLIAKEYCAAQVDDPGVLIVSEFAGAAAELHSHALVVNPYDVEQVAEAIFSACTMDEDQRSEHMRAMQEHIRAHDIFQWVDSYVEALSAIDGDQISLVADRFHKRRADDIGQAAA